jgi:hypothetical protein
VLPQDRGAVVKEGVAMRKRFTLEIAMENAAFNDDPAVEVARILAEVSEDVEQGIWTDFARDTNGNKVCTFRYEGPDLPKREFDAELERKYCLHCGEPFTSEYPAIVGTALHRACAHSPDFRPGRVRFNTK